MPRTDPVPVATANNFLLLNNVETGVNDNVLLMTYKDPVLPISLILMNKLVPWVGQLENILVVESHQLRDEYWVLECQGAK